MPLSSRKHWVLSRIHRLVRYDLDSIFYFVCGVIDVEMLGFVWVMDVRLSFSHLSFCIF